MSEATPAAPQQKPVLKQRTTYSATVLFLIALVGSLKDQLPTEVAEVLTDEFVAAAAALAWAAVVYFRQKVVTQAQG